jgi:hypothetical protein
VVEIDGKTIVGKVKEKEQAVNTYVISFSLRTDQLTQYFTG